MYHIRTQQDECNCKPFVNKNPSETLPHQAMTIEEIYLSIAQGIIPDLVNYAEDDPFVPHDLTDFDDALATVDNEFDDLPKEETATPVAEPAESSQESKTE